ncbi:hypothetical protein [Streptomyces sp. CC219B]|uniref:hypothetical protein n=1 Tax=Streptomyces sp. CC219B TaxID=3044574 RepID=UPI0024A9E9B2|nr:hypothetical protein [Streptomyces sp. CC219B]
MDPDVEFVDTEMPSTESIVAELRRLDRAATLWDAAAGLLKKRCQHASRAIFCQGITHAASLLEQWADEAEKDTSSGRQPSGGESTPDGAEPLIVARYDVAMEPAPEEEPALTVGAVAEDGRPVALLFAPETRDKVAKWLAPADTDGAELVRLRTFASATERRHNEIRARLGMVDIRDSAEAWDLGMAIIAILDGPCTRPRAPHPRSRSGSGPACTTCSPRRPTPAPFRR